MYTIFYNQISILLTDSLDNLLNDSFFYSDNIAIEAIVEIAESKKHQVIYLYHFDLKLLWKEFKKFFKIERAAGGLVKNKNNETLFIYRFDTWDLPKGKIEKGESKKQAAVREVEEESGISKLRIQGKLQKTYHIFHRKERIVLKITHWYSMYSDYEGMLKPQVEEGITNVVFKNEDEVQEAMENTYENIKLLF